MTLPNRGRFLNGANPVLFVVLMLITGLSLLPFLWIFTGAFKTNTEFFGSTAILPQAWNVENFVTVWVDGNFWVYFRNNVLAAAGVTLIGVVVAAPAGYAFAKLPIKRFPMLFYLYLFGITLPIESIVVPLFYQVKAYGLVDNLWGLILALVGTGVPFGVYLMRSFFRDLPDSLAEAARIDGATEWEIFRRIMLPLSAPGLLALGVFSFLSAWNEFLLSILLLIRPENRTIPIGLIQFQEQNMSDYGALFAAITIAIVPSILIYIVLQRSFISGLAAGATKG
jgi:ABC-type glycerol-3-phosphate transport system permease component